MDIAKQKEQFSIAFVNAIAAQAGLNNAQLSVDDDSVDLMLVGKGFSGNIRNPQLQIQLKCTSQNLVKDKTLNFPLSKKNYDDLRGDDILCPRYLVVLIVPNEVDEWANLGDNELILRNSCYWISLRNHPDSTNTSKVTIKIPLKQKLTKEVLVDLMNSASNGDSL